MTTFLILVLYLLSIAGFVFGMANITQAFGTSSSFTITMTSLGNGSSREATVLDVTGIANVLDIEIMVLAKTTTGTIGANNPRVDIYAHGSVDGSTYPDTLTGADAGYSGNLSNLIAMRSLNVVASNTQYISAPISLAQAFGGSLPAKVGLVVTNNTGLALSSTASENKILYRVIYATSV